MATRGVENNFRTSINQSTKQEFLQQGTDIVGAIAPALTNIIEENQKAKITENFSQAQMEINNLNRQFQLDYQGDPFNKDGLDALKQNRNAIFKKYEDGISPFFKSSYTAMTRELDFKSQDLTKAYGYAQTKKNTVGSINKSIENSVSQAAIDGESGVDLATAMTNFTTSKKSLIQTADGVLGEVEATSLLEDFDQDYLKMYLSGKATSDPVGALNLLESDEVKNSFQDKKQYGEMKSAIESRALRVQDIAIENEVIGALKSQANIFKQNKPLSYAELQVVTEKMSEPAKKFFMKKSGFSKETTKLDSSQKIELKAGIVNDIANLMSQEQIKTSDIGKLQDNIFSAMSKGALTEKEGLNLINQLIEPTLQDREEQIGTSLYDSGNWNPLSDNVGLPVINDFYENQVLIKPLDGEEEVGLVSKTLNNTNKANLYDYYFQALQGEAQTKGMTIAQMNNSGSRSERREIYQRATDKALNEFRANTTPLTLRSGIPQGAIQHLLKNPDLSDRFDEMYGTGAANRILGR